MEKRKSVLLVDDDIYVLEAAKEVLKYKYNIITATSGEEAIEIIKKEPQNLVILDINLGGISGIETLEIIRSIDDNLPVIMLSGMNTIKTVIKSIKLGANDFLDKPFDIKDLRNAVQEAIGDNGKDTGNGTKEISVDIEQFAQNTAKYISRGEVKLKNALQQFKEEYIDYIHNKFRSKSEDRMNN